MCSNGKYEEYRKLYAEFQKKVRQDKEQSIIDKYKQIEDNNKMAKTRDLFKINIVKTKILPYIHSAILKDITIDNIKIDIVNNYKCLGIYLDSQMTYKKHIHYLSNKLSKINQNYH